MADAVTSDAVESLRATLARAGPSRPKVTLPPDAAGRVPEGDVVRLVLDGTVRHAAVERGLEGDTEIRGAYDTARMARERDGRNRLVEWVDGVGLELGRTVHLDVVVSGARYGLRAPGEQAVYRVPDRSAEGLVDIARDLTGQTGSGSGPGTPGADDR